MTEDADLSLESKRPLYTTEEIAISMMITASCFPQMKKRERQTADLVGGEKWENSLMDVRWQIGRHFSFCLF
jgi:hypothetical protein